MIYQNEPILIRFTVVSICIALLFSSIGCADRKIGQRADVSEEFKIASEALAKAEEAMEKAGIAISFSDLGDLGAGNITEILPSPLDLAQLEKENPELIRDAIESMYSVLDALPGQAISVPAAPLAPAVEPPVLSKSDLMLLHLHLGYLYVLKVVGKLALEGMGPDGKPNTEDDLFLIEFPEDFENEEGYKFELTDNGHARFDAIAKLPDPKPEDYLKQFTESERQAIIDSLFLLLGAKVRILPIPAVGIKEQTPQIDKRIYRRDALFHFEKATELAKAIAPELEDALDEFNRVIAKVFAEDFLEKAEEWHFKVENIDEVEERLRKLIGKAK
ncbi:TPA: hypothetical protein EYP66_05770 [Candidatus Poribacteria bacterium]|nr:hypothetical protein [Candidatus Poribacteria bacterium]